MVICSSIFVDTLDETGVAALTSLPRKDWAEVSVYPWIPNMLLYANMRTLNDLNDHIYEFMYILFCHESNVCPVYMMLLDT